MVDLGGDVNDRGEKRMIQSYRGMELKVTLDGEEVTLTSLTHIEEALLEKSEEIDQKKLRQSIIDEAKQQLRDEGYFKVDWDEFKEGDKVMIVGEEGSYTISSEMENDEYMVMNRGTRSIFHKSMLRKVEDVK